MPQLDIATYFGQVSWFSRVFLGFYLAMVGDLLPTLNRAIKMRSKKAEVQRDQVRLRASDSGVRSAVEGRYDSSHAQHGKRVLGRLQLRRNHLTSGENRSSFSLLSPRSSRSRQKGGAAQAAHRSVSVSMADSRGRLESKILSTYKTRSAVTDLPTLRERQESLGGSLTSPIVQSRKLSKASGASKKVSVGKPKK